MLHKRATFLILILVLAGCLSNPFGQESAPEPEIDLSQLVATPPATYTPTPLPTPFSTPTADPITPSVTAQADIQPENGPPVIEVL
ncbi:MAG: hypothetical protein AAF633_22120, partial [Chloroflexota bacterium]